MNSRRPLALASLRGLKDYGMPKLTKEAGMKRG